MIEVPCNELDTGFLTDMFNRDQLRNVAKRHGVNRGKNKQDTLTNLREKGVKILVYARFR